MIAYCIPAHPHHVRATLADIYDTIDELGREVRFHLDQIHDSQKVANTPDQDDPRQIAQVAVALDRIKYHREQAEMAYECMAHNMDLAYYLISLLQSDGQTEGEARWEDVVIHWLFYAYKSS